MDDDELVAAVAARHAGTATGGRWDAAAEILPLTSVLFSREIDADAYELRTIMAGIGTLLAHTDVATVPLFSVGDPSVPEEHRPLAASGPPEADIFALALDRPERTVWALTGTLRCRLRILTLIAAGYLLRRLASAAPGEHRNLLRRLAWLTDARVSDPVELLTQVAGSRDPLLRMGNRGKTGAPADTGPWPFSGWAQWPATERITLAGRVSAVRAHRRTTFVDLTWDGRTAQLSMEAAVGGNIRAGDLLAVSGSTGRTRTGADTVFVEEVQRHRPSHTGGARRPVGADRSAVELSDLLARLRPALAAERFLEAITPILTTSSFGGASRPFSTWSAATSETAYLRVTTELALLGLVANGWSRCYEIGPSFRNEGLRGDALKEFLMLEAYAVDVDLPEMADVVITLVGEVLEEPLKAEHVDFDVIFQRLSGVSTADVSGVQQLAKRLAPATAERTADPDVLVRRLWRGTYRHQLGEGLIVVRDIPGSGSPFIAGRGRSADRLWLYLDSLEIAEISRNELDPATLHERLEQALARDPYAVHRDYREVLDVFANGIPPCVGLGLGLGRLASVRTSRREASGLGR
ncbi:amino acid--tRNA ligase-related protein [Paractinoplanes maris]|uniref:amino acid--tRNA ligase-related protein n=1 Tax=Paractinoplanes maris TaxID=1734446 RepID=UPI002020564C|nr:amino acid--tRNA ligase-related protein [Actinoplanes maris]